MKTSGKNILFNFLLLLFLTAFGGEVFASVTYSTNSNREQQKHSVSNQDKAALFIDEVSVSEISENFQDNQPEPLLLELQFTQGSLIRIHSQIQKTSVNVPADIKTRLEQQIFPFHFFW